MDKIKAYDDRTLRKSTRAAAVAAGIVLIAMGGAAGIQYAAAIGFFLILAVIMGKETYITEEGISVEYDFLVYKHIVRWDFTEITDIHVEDIKNTEYQVLYFLRNMMTRRLVFCGKDEIEAVAQMAQKRNSSIHIEAVNSYDS